MNKMNTIRKCDKCGYETVSSEDENILREHSCGGLMTIIKTIDTLGRKAE